MSAAISRKRKSPEPERDSVNEDHITTPSNSPARKKLKITQHQKQTLIDNLQLEITERARGLRAQYALQAQDLRSRIERRVNRIPVALRKTTMGALLEKHNNVPQAQSPKKSALPARTTIKTATTKIIPRDPDYPTISVAKSPSRRTKETSNGGSYSDKENAPVPDAHIPLENPKKRGNPAASGQPRSVSQVLRDAESKVLSPKSSNSRTYKQSPLITSPTKASYLSRPASPLKPSSPLKAMIEDARARTTRTETKKPSPPASVRRTKATAQTKRTATKSANPVPVKSPARPATRQQDRHMSSSTTSSNASSGTTIVKATRKAQRATATTSSAAAKRTTVARSQGPTAAANAKRAAATTRKVGTDAPVSTGRVLRKRV
ncbi:hypothetical protein UA08_06008 [Talaromyces atroroseus]|uniref:Borealin N-terminal domain-containing protein n=1 Tax=Talaromyces atroroseus TaxID=1441469 RepID=A0A225ARY9_TALAT|nr:hypothetical protein UA08_06008 [Talaromyces atroroseus]OKL58349.1 hypothetical protein UA08_06008 [Talaromyces atroroseus]